MKLERLDKIITSEGQYSRKEVKQLIREGKVFLNGEKAQSPEEKLDPSSAEIEINGKPVLYQKNIYLMLNKPNGVITATEDKKDRTVIDLLPESYRRRNLFPVGRLDKDTEGLLLITNDGDLAHCLLSPKKHVDKVYFVRVNGTLNQEDIHAFQNGISLEDGVICKEARLQILSEMPSDPSISEALVTIQEGKFHQIKRMFQAVGKQVLYLKRLQMGPLLLDHSLEPGAFRPLSEQEIKQLKNSSNILES